MKRIRNGVFETNSSSTHSMTIMDSFDFKRWKEDPTACYDEDKDEIISLDQRNDIVKKDIIEYRKKYYPDRILDKIEEDELEDYVQDNNYDLPLTYREFQDYRVGDYLEMDTNTFTTKANEQLTIICVYGHD